jgi:hypothetical protein
MIHSATCFLGLNQRNYPNSGCNFLDLVFFLNFDDLSFVYCIVRPDNFHPPFIIHCTMPVRRSKNISTYGWSSLYNETSDSINFDLSNAFGILPHALLLHKTNKYGLPYYYLNWFISYLTSRQSYVRSIDIYSSPFVVLSGVSQGLVLRPLISIFY